MTEVSPAPTRPFAPFEWMIAFRYLRARRKGSFVSVIAGFSFLGIMLGVATLIVVMSVMNGFHKELLDKIVGINGHIFLQAADSPLTDYDEVVNEVAALPGVDLAIPMIEAPAAASTTNMAFALVRGVREADIKRLPGVAGNVKQGSLEGFDKAGGVAIGQRLAENLGLRIGDKVKILIANGAQTPFGVTPRTKVYPIVAIFQIGMAEFDNLFVYLPLPEAQAFFSKDNEASVIEVFLHRPEDLDAVRGEIDQAVMRPMIMTDWRERNKTFFDALTVERNVMFIILTLIVLVAALNIVSGLIMLVKDKGHDIAVLRTMGATRGGDHAHLPDHRRLDRGRWDLRRISSWPACGEQCRGGSPDPELASPRQYISGGDLLPFARSKRGRSARRAGGRVDDSRAFGAGDDLSVLARGEARSSRSAALRIAMSAPALQSPKGRPQL